MLRTRGVSMGDVAYEGREQGRCCVLGEGAGKMLRTRGGRCCLRGEGAGEMLLTRGGSRGDVSY